MLIISIRESEQALPEQHFWSASWLGCSYLYVQMRATHQKVKKNKTCSRGKQQQQWLWETKTIAYVNPLKDILGRFMLIPEMGLEHRGVRASLVFGHRKQRFSPHGQTTNRQLRRKQGVCQLSGSFSSRPASLRPLTASVGTCPTLSNISTLIHTE